jgi:hypothetical protein
VSVILAPLKPSAQVWLLSPFNTPVLRKLFALWASESERLEGFFLARQGFI